MINVRPEDDVSTAITADLLQTLDAADWPIRPDWTASGLDISVLRSRRGWISWRTYLRVFELLGTAQPGPCSYEALGEAQMSGGVSGVLRHFGRLVDGVPTLYRIAYVRILRSLIRVVRSELDASDPNRLVLNLRVDPSRESGEVFFRVTAGTLRKLPKLLGLPDARVEATFSKHSATMVVRVPRSQSVGRRVRRALSVLSGATGQADALATLMEEVDVVVTNLADARQRLAEAQDRWSALSAAIPGLVVELASDGTVVEVRGARQRPDALTPGVRWSSLFDGAGRSVIDEQVREAAAGRHMAPVEVRTTHGAWWSCGLGPVAGDPPRLLAVAADVTERLQTREALRETERRLLHAQKLEAIGRLSSGLAHDINNVLATVQAHTDLLGVRVGSDPNAARSLDGIRTSVGRASALTRRLLTAASRPRGATPEVADLAGAVRGARALFGVGLGEAIRFDLDAPTTRMLVGIDESRLEQVLLNLVLNARDAQPDGGVVRIVVTEQDAATALLTVSDEGTGMAPDVLARATEPFFTTKPIGLGSGLGLSTVREVVEGAGGRLSIESATGVGTSVCVVLPRVKGDPPRAEPVASLRRGAGERVLLVEDDVDLRATVAQMLTLVGYDVLALASAEAALEAIDAGSSVDVVVTDVVMPGIGGLGLLAVLRERSPRLPVLLMSGLVEPSDDLGAGPRPDAFLVKPFRLGELSATIGKLLHA